MTWLRETHGIKFELVRHFLARMLDGEWSSMPGQWQNVVVSAFALLLPAGMLLVQGPTLPGPWNSLQSDAPPVPLAGQLALLTLVFAVTGMIALIQWQNLFPGRRDYLSLAGLPIRSRQIFAARFGAVLMFSIALVVAMNLLPSLMARNRVAQVAASGLGCFFVTFAIVALQGVLLNLLPARWFARISAYVQGLLIGVLLLGGFYSWSIKQWPPQTLARLPEFGSWAPPVWFAGLEERMAGSSDPFFARMAERALIAVAAAAVLMVLTYLLSYRRYRTLLIEAPVQVEAPRKRQWSVLGWLARNPQQEAVMQFMAKTLARSRAHRVIWLAYIGAALAVVLNSSVIDGEFLRRRDGHGFLEMATPWSNTVKFMVLFWPLSTSVVLLTGFRHVLSIPSELAANWIFRLNESHCRRDWMQAVERFVILYAVAPIHLLLFPVAVERLGLGLALRMTVLQVLVSLTIFELLFQSWQQLPFTCSYVPGKRPLVAILGGYMAALGIGVPILSLIIRAGSQFTGVFVIYFAFFLAAWLLARRGRREGWGEARLVYEDLPWDVPNLGIAEMSYGARVIHPAPADEPHLRGPAPLLPSYDIPGGNSKGVMPAAYLAEFWRDVRYGLRMLARSPGFTAVALISLTLGIGVATSAFSEMNGFVLRDVPGVKNPGELVVFESVTSYPDYKRYRERGDLFSSTLAYVAPVPFGVSTGGHTERTWGHLITSSYFATLGVRPSMGRAIGREDEQPGRTPTVVVSYRFWQNRLGSDPAVIGKAVRINGQPCTVIGVGPQDFQGASPMVYGADLWLPVSVGGAAAPELSDNAVERRDKAIFHVVGRLLPRVTVARAEAELDAVARQIEREAGDPNRDQRGRRVTLLPGGKLLPMRKEGLPFITGYFALLGGMILLIAGSNVANMMLARAADRRKEIAVRLALGASRARLIRQLLTECLLIAAAAGVLGFLAATWLMRLASQIRLPWPMPLSFDLAPDGRVLLFTIALTGFTALAFGLLPALQATRTDLTPALKEGGNVQLRRFRRLSLRNVLVVSQVAGSLALLLITGFLVLGHRRLIGTEVGFDPRNIYLLSLDPIRDGYPADQADAFLRRLLDRVQRLPSVSVATLADNTPMEMIGRPPVTFSVSDSRTISSARRYIVGRDFFQTIGIPILRGRGFRKEDESNDATAIIVNERLVRDCWPGQDALGRRIEIGSADIPAFFVGSGPKGASRRNLSGQTRVGVVVGVAKNIRDGLDMSAKDLPAILYLPLGPADVSRPSLQGVTLVLRAKPGVDAIGAGRREIAAMDDRLTPFHARSMVDQIDTMMAAVRPALWTYGCLGIFGLILASVGLAGVTAYSVTQRRREIGIRMALGARRIDVLGLVMKEGAVLVLIGSVIGFAAARAGTRMLAAIMSDVARSTGMSTSDPLLLIGGPLLLAVLALVACYVPARRSMRIDPVRALRQE